MGDTTGTPPERRSHDDDPIDAPWPGASAGAEDADRWEPWPPAEPAPATGADRALRTTQIVAVAVAAALTGAVVGAGAVLLGGNGAPDVAPAATVVERVETRVVESPAVGALTAPAEVARRVLPSIVTVEQGLVDDEGFIRTGGGSGVVLDTDGHVATNHHVVDGASHFRVVFADGRIVPATLVGSDGLTDLAVLSIAFEGLTPIELGTTATLAVGDAAYAMGNPLTLEGGPSVTSGVISAFDRRVRLQGDTELYGMLQTDAPITRGSSGGALVDSEGRLVGITTAVGVSDLGQEGLGFAIPVELVRRITDELIRTGMISHAFLGIEGGTYYSEAPDLSSTPAGVEVAAVVPGTAAEAAGIRAGDIITSYRGVPLTTMEQLVLRLRLSAVGDEVAVAILREDEVIVLDVRLLERPEGT